MIETTNSDSYELFNLGRQNILYLKGEEGQLPSEVPPDLYPLMMECLDDEKAIWINCFLVNEMPLAWLSFLILLNTQITVRKNNLIIVMPTPFVAFNGNTEKVKELIKKGADINAKDFKGESPITLASYHGHLGVVEALLKANAKALKKLSLGSELISWDSSTAASKEGAVRS